MDHSWYVGGSAEVVAVSKSLGAEVFHFGWAGGEGFDHPDDAESDGETDVDHRGSACAMGKVQ